MSNNILYAQSGGPTAVINTTACGVIDAASREPRVGRVFAGVNGILGVLHEDLIDTSLESPETIAALKHTPGAAFGSCRFKLKDPATNPAQYQRFFDVLKAHEITTFLYNGGGDSHDTAYKISQASGQFGYPINCLGLPKTIDNDLAVTDNSPGFGSVAKYIAISTQETARDLVSMAATSTKVFILEVMGRHAGWIAAAAALGKSAEHHAPHMILLPEVAFDPEKFIARTKACVEQYGHCFIVASEGIKDASGRFYSEQGTHDAFGHEQLGGLAPKLAHLIQSKLGYKYHWAVSDYLQRSATHIASATDVAQAHAVGVKAIELAAEEKTNLGLTIQRLSDSPYKWDIGTTDLGSLANIEAKLPAHYIAQDGMGVTSHCMDYMRPLIVGEAYPPYENGMPVFAELSDQRVEKKLAAFNPEQSTTTA